MRWLRWLGAAVAVVAVLVVAAVVYVATLDLGSYKGEIEAALRDGLGRNVEIDGPLHLTWTPRPGVRASEVRVANAEWGSEPAMATVGDLAVGIELRPLLLGRVEVHRLRLTDARLLLERGPDGQGNWQVGDTGGQGGGGAGGDEPSIRGFELSNSTILWKPGPDAEASTYRIARLRLDDTGLTEPFAVELSAELQGRSLELAGSVPSLALLRRSEATGPVDLEGRFDGTPVALAGDLRIGRTGDGGVARLSVEGLKGSYGDLAATGEAVLELAGERPRLQAQLRAETLDLTPYLGGDGGGDGGNADGRLDRPLPVGLLPPLDGTADITVGRLIAGRWTLDELAATASLDQGVLTLDPVKGKVADGAVSGRAELDSRKSPVQVSVAAAGRQLNMGKVYEALMGQGLIEGTGEAAAELRASGTTPRQLLGSADGVTRLIIRDGVILNRYWELIAADLTAEFLPFTKDSDRSNLNCLVSRFDIRNGVAEATVLMIDSDRVLIGGDGTVNLGKQTLDMRLVPQPKDPALISLATPILLTGPISDPQPAPDPVAVAKGIGTLAAGTLIGPLGLLLPFVSTGSADNPCPEAIAAAEDSRRPAAGQSSKEQDKAGGIKGLFEDLRKAIE